MSVGALGGLDGLAGRTAGAQPNECSQGQGQRERWREALALWRSSRGHSVPPSLVAARRYSIDYHYIRNWLYCQRHMGADRWALRLRKHG